MLTITIRQPIFNSTTYLRF